MWLRDCRRAAILTTNQDPEHRSIVLTENVTVEEVRGNLESRLARTLQNQVTVAVAN